MSPYPDTNVTTREAPPVLSAPLDSTRLLIVGESFRGGRDPIRFRNPAAVARALERSGVGILTYDAIDVALREGVPEVHFVRLFGVAPVAASLALAGGTGTVATLEAREEGEWANGATGGLKAAVVNGPNGAAERVVVIYRGDGAVPVEQTSAVTSRAELAAALNQLSLVKLKALGADVGLPTEAAKASLDGGTADAGTITAATQRAAAERVLREQGPMQVVAPSRYADASNQSLLEYAGDFNRTAYLGQTDGLSVAAIKASCAALRALGTGAEGVPRLGGMWAQFATGPGVLPGTTRTVPWAVVQAGLTARLEQQEGHPNVAPAGDAGVPRWATGCTRYFTEAEARELFEAGCNVVENYLGVPRNATFRTLEPEDTSEWEDLAHTRTDRAVRAIAFALGRSMGHKLINRATIAEFGTLFRTRLRPLYDRGALFGDTFDAAVLVDVDSVNTLETMRAKEVNVDVGLAMSEHADVVNVNITKVPIGTGV